MTSHELARQLLTGPDLPVVVPGTGMQEGGYVNLTKIAVTTLAANVGTFEYIDPFDAEEGSPLVQVIALE